MLGLLALSAACGEQAALRGGADLDLRVEAETGPVAPGEGLALVVERSWAKRLAPEPWTPALAPLVLRHESGERRESATHVRETDRYRAFAFTLDDVRVVPPPLHARPVGGGPVQTVRADPLHVRVRPALDPARPGPPEVPGGPVRAPRSPWPFALAAAAFLAAFLLLRPARGRAPPASPASPPPARSPEATALAALAALAGRAAVPRRARRSGSDRADDVARACDIVRGYLAARFLPRALSRGRPEILASLPPEARGAAEALARVLQAGELAKFAAHRPDENERAAAIEDAAAFVRACGAPPREVLP
jgi:hypothetical protein